MSAEQGGGTNLGVVIRELIQETRSAWQSSEVY
jgi:hypothetical protein